MSLRRSGPGRWNDGGFLDGRSLLPRNALMNNHLPAIRDKTLEADEFCTIFVLLDRRAARGGERGDMRAGRGRHDTGGGRRLERPLRRRRCRPFRLFGGVFRPCRGGRDRLDDVRRVHARDPQRRRGRAGARRDRGASGAGRRRNVKGAGPLCPGCKRTMLTWGETLVLILLYRHASIRSRRPIGRASGARDCASLAAPIRRAFPHESRAGQGGTGRIPDEGTAGAPSGREERWITSGGSRRRSAG